jgi:hypothetical protein
MNAVICPACSVQMNVVELGVYVLETMGHPKAEPYRLWRADLLQCGVCDVRIVARFASTAFAEHFDPDFKERLAEAEESKQLYCWFERPHCSAKLIDLNLGRKEST